MIPWSRAFRYRQTAWLLASAGIGYLLLLIGTAFHPASVTLGGLIAAAMVAAWFRQFREAVPSAGNLLDQDVFRRWLGAARHTQIMDPAARREFQRLALSCHESARQIAAQEPALYPELTEVLHTVVALTEQPSQAKRDRLVATHQQLQQLRDQVLLAPGRAVEPEASLTAQLQTLIQLNRTVQ
ncbi:hypothetical protein IQ241_05350 [Romeria aff. gracilis LEGE 07310]|uniref:Uncharacterized protein n=1 Tax=Vasconcelosia minhoensis LEGE 07310 TaxID=915328 RepID=A0A8J7A5D9_9CYAN|nr:hypothetical protein [Romeria gracilis]MBE9076727.1 hypothetical protein [Romeria aff. gracilis LEGE 07310]